jgi:hypothetical protein
MKRPALIALLALGGLTAAAHEFWVEFPRFVLQPGQTLHFRMLVGEGFKGEPWGNKASKIKRLVRYGPARADSTDLTPAAGFAEADTLRTAVAFAHPGTHVVALQSNNAFIELPGKKFTAYLREEGLEYALKRRQQLGEDSLPGRETYRRCAKTLVQVGPASAVPAAADSTCLRPLGLPLELVPEQNPYRLAADKSLTVRVLRHGQPLRGALVQVWQRQPGGAATTHFSTYSNQRGRALLRLSGPGPYLLATVQMSTAPAALRARADWQSTWASLTFGGPAAGGGRRLPGR